MTRMFFIRAIRAILVIVLECSGEAGRHCEFVRGLAGDLTLIYEPWIAEPNAPDNSR